MSFTAEELAAAVGLSVAAIAELERYGLLASRSVAQGRRYDEDAVVVAKLAARFANFGIEAGTCGCSAWRSSGSWHSTSR
ncbi:MAG: hypothetical protein R2755_10380 [Acidimicrobiales bacterium]